MVYVTNIQVLVIKFISALKYARIPKEIKSNSTHRYPQNKKERLTKLNAHIQDIHKNMIIQASNTTLPMLTL